MTLTQQFFYPTVAAEPTTPDPGATSISATTPHAINTTWYLLDATAPTGALNQLVSYTIPSGSPTYFDCLWRGMSRPLAAQTIASGSWTFLGTVMNQGADKTTVYSTRAKPWGVVLRVWRPSTSSFVGTIFDGATASSDPTATQQNVFTVTYTQTYAGSSVTVQAGDVLVCEVWSSDNVLNTSGTAVIALTGTNAMLTAPAALTMFLATASTVSSRAVGESSAGGVLLCEPNQNPATYSVQVDWTNTGTYVDESSYVRSVSVQRGRQQVTDQFGTGRCVVTFRNLSGRFSLFNTASALYPNVAYGRPIRVSIIYHGVTYRVFTGVTGDMQQVPLLPATVQTTCYDPADRFSRQQTNPGALRTTTVDAAIAAILAAAGWSGTSTLDAGAALTLYAPPTSNVLQQLQDAAEQEPGAHVFIDKNGAVVYQNATHRQSNGPLLTLDSADPKRAPDGDTLLERATDLYDSIMVTYDTEALPATWVTLGTIAQNTTVATGSHVLSASYGTAGAPATPVAETDFQFTSAASGGGSDVTSQVQLTSFVDTGTGFQATFNNTSGATAYVNYLNVQGVATANTSVQYQGQTGTPIYPGTNVISGTITAQGLLAVLYPVASTDYTFTATATGGTDYTASVTVSSWAVSGATFTLTVSNTLPFVVYLGIFQLRGVVIASVQTPRTLTLTAAQQLYDQQLQETLAWVTSSSVVQLWAEQRLSALNAPRPRPRLTIAGRTALLTHAILAAELGSRVVFYDAGAPWLTGIQSNMFIEYMQIDITPPQNGNTPHVQAQWSLFDSVQGAA